MLNSDCNAVNNGDIDSGIYKICCTTIVELGFLKGLVIGVLLSIPLWISIIGWIKIIFRGWPF